MAEDFLSPHSPGLMAAIEDPVAMTIWELLRLGRGASVEELAALGGQTLAATTRSLDRLLAAGLVASRPAGRGRKAVTYRVTRPEIRVSLDGISSAEADRIFSRWQDGLRERFARITRPTGGPRGEGQKRGFAMDWAYLSDEERLRIREFAGGIFGIVAAARDRHAKAHPDGLPPGDGKSMPYAFLFELVPVTEPPVPIASVVFTKQPVAGRQLADDAAKRASLAAREREVAEALAAGHSRPAIARRLGLSPHTIASLTRRIYAKLGVKTRAELARVMASRV